MMWDLVVFVKGRRKFVYAAKFDSIVTLLPSASIRLKMFTKAHNSISHASINLKKLNIHKPQFFNENRINVKSKNLKYDYKTYILNKITPVLCRISPSVNNSQGWQEYAPVTPKRMRKVQIHWFYLLQTGDKKQSWFLKTKRKRGHACFIKNVLSIYPFLFYWFNQ